MDEQDNWARVTPANAKRFMKSCMLAVNCPDDHADVLSELLMTADQRGHYSHGLNRLEMYVGDVKANLTTSDAEPEILKQNAATAWVDGRNLLGPVVGRFCMDLAIKKAKEVGVGWVAAKGSNHYGIAGWYSMRACDKGLLGMSCTNTSPVVVPTRAKDPALGTNPLSLAAPGRDVDTFVLDMATSTVALGKIEMAARKQTAIPNGWGCDINGKETNSPEAVLEGGGLMPLGGAEECGGYKGYGLAMMVEVLCGILSGAAFGPNIRKWYTMADSVGEQPSNLGQCFIAVDPQNFAPGFEDRMTSLMQHCRSMTPAVGTDGIMVPGDPEKKNIERCEKLGGIPYHPNQIIFANKLAAKLGVELMQTL